MSTPRNVYLIGPMGAGKSTVGRQLSRQLGKQFVDCDRELEARTGVTIPIIFELEGEEGFRKREHDMLAMLVERDDVVMATGGGVVLDERNRALLMSRGFVVYLNAPLGLLLARTSHDKNRPLLQTDDPRSKLEQIVNERDPLYRQTADMIVKTDRRSSRYVVKDIVTRLEAL